MKAFIVFAAVIAIAAANAVGRSSGGWAPTIDLELQAAAAAAAAGEASAGQSLVELVSGNAAVPATLVSLNGVYSEVAQGEDIVQLANADLTTGATSTIQGVDAYNDAIGLDFLEAELNGANSAVVINNAQSAASGDGAVAIEAGSLNVVNGRK